MALTLAQLETEVLSLQTNIQSMPTMSDYDTLVDLITARHTTLLDAVSAFSAQVVTIEDAIISAQRRILDLETRVTALE